jgi:hypothetical protein
MGPTNFGVWLNGFYEFVCLLITLELSRGLMPWEGRNYQNKGPRRGRSQKGPISGND